MNRFFLEMAELNKAEIKVSIQKEIVKTKNLISEYKELTKPIEPENAIGRISRIDAINNKSVTEAALRKAELKLNKLQKALSKINSNDFGICIRCKQIIPIKRIILMPQVQTCVNCSH